MKCPRCGKELSGKWGDTGLVPSQHILVQKCPCSPDLISEREIVDETIKRNTSQLQQFKTWHRTWPDSLDLIVRESGCTEQMVRSRLVHFDLY